MNKVIEKKLFFSMDSVEFQVQFAPSSQFPCQHTEFKESSRKTKFQNVLESYVIAAPFDLLMKFSWIMHLH